MIVIATNNEHKLNEYKEILDNNVDIKCINDFNIKIEPCESGHTLVENAFIKAKYTYDELLKRNFIKRNDYVVADDTGLFINFLDNGPGIYSARFLHPLNQEDKNRIIVDMMKGINNIEARKAYFKTIIFVYSDSISKAFEGKVDGYISDSISGNGGFGYDNIFIPIKYKDTKKTYADIGDEKNDISHRRLAINKMLKFMESEE